MCAISTIGIFDLIIMRFTNIWDTTSNWNLIGKARGEDAKSRLDDYEQMEYKKRVNNKNRATKRKAHNCWDL